MTATATSTTTMKLLVPSSLLPGEGDELSLDSLRPTSPGVAGMFSAYQKLAAARAPRFVLTADDIKFEGDLGEETALQLMSISAEEDLVQLLVCPAMSHFDWAGVIRDVSDAMKSDHFLGTPEELARVFTEAVREVAAIAALGFTGDAIPMLTVDINDADKSATIAFLGIWLSEKSAADELRQALPGQSWLDGASVGQTTCILLDAAEVEGRGMKEALISAAMLAMVFGSTAQAGDAQVVKTKSSGSKLASFFGIDTRPGDKLEVKTQKLVQDHPRIYKDVLARESCDLRVIIDIGAQRAYLLKDGAIAFETPISTGRGAKMTPRGTFTITEKVRSGKYSTIYKCPLPGWMRIGELPIGMHEGQLPGYPASHGCVRMPLESALFIFDHAPKGTTVQILNSWSPQAAGDAMVASAN